MPLMKSGSKKAFEHNLKIEMNEGKPMKQALAIAYDMKRRNAKKKMAEGGPVSAKVEQKPMPSEVNNDKHMVMQNKHPMMENKAIKPKIEAKSGPSMAKSNAFTARLIDENDIMQSMPPKDETKHIAYDDKHALESPMMAEGGMINKEISMEAAEEDNAPEMPKKQNNDIIGKSESLFDSLAADRDERLSFDDHESIAEAIMAKRKMMAEGGRVVPNHPGDSELAEGQVDIDDNAYELPNAYYKRNEDEVLKENYDSDFMDLSQPEDSNEHGHDIESDEHDMISKIRSQMNKHRQFKVK